MTPDQQVTELHNKIERLINLTDVKYDFTDEQKKSFLLPVGEEEVEMTETIQELYRGSDITEWTTNLALAGAVTEKQLAGIVHNVLIALFQMSKRG